MTTTEGAPPQRTPKDIRAVDLPVNLSPTLSHHQQQSTGAGRAEAQSVAADHVVLYTILHELCNLRMITIGVYVYSRLIVIPGHDESLDNCLVTNLSFFWADIE